VDQYIIELVKLFQGDPLQFFHEKEMHSAFFGLSRGRSGNAQTKDMHIVSLLRQDYNTLWRYRRRGVNGFKERLSNKGEGDVGEVDFVLLKEEFVKGHIYLEVMNKEEDIRSSLRINPWAGDGTSQMIERGVEFKMAHVHPVGPRPRIHGVTPSDFNDKGMILDCRKLACERVGIGYSVAFLHKPYLDWLDVPYVTGLFVKCVGEWMECYDGPDNRRDRLRLLIVSPDKCYWWGCWEVEFPHGVGIAVSS
jgi:hypothetical protein